MGGASDEVKKQVRERYLSVARDLSQKDLAPDQVARKTAQKVWDEFSYDNRTLRKWTEQYREDGAFVGEAEDQQHDTDSVKQTKSSQLTDQQKHLIHLLPAEESQILDKLGISPKLLRHHINRLEERDVVIEHDDDAGVYYLPDQPQKRRLSTKAKQSITKEANQFRTEQEAAVLRRLRAKEPLKSDGLATEGNEDLVVAMSDTHFGDVVEDQQGREVYDPQIAAASVEWFTRKVLDLKSFQEGIVDFDMAHLVWGGDMLTCEGIYSGQAYDIELLLADQLSLTVETLTQQAATLADEFDELQIVAVPGNHGQIRSSYTSGQANMDLVAYRWICDRLIERGYDNINFLVGEASHYRDFELRGGKWRMGLRHGHDEQLHVDATARSEADQRGLIERHDVDGFVRGHHHTHRHEEVLNEYPVITLPSAKPGGEFAEKIGRPDCSTKRKLGACWRCGDSRLITGYYCIDDIGLDVSDMDVPSIEDIRKRSMMEAS